MDSNANRENTKHDILLIIATALFILFATGLALPVDIPDVPFVITP